MTFRPEYLDELDRILKEFTPSIRAFPGCHHLEILRDIHEPHLAASYSLWDNEDALNAYRKSELFGKVWPKLKAGFSDKPVAHSYERIMTLE